MSRILTLFEYDRIIGSIRQEVERTVRDFLCEAVWLTIEPLKIPPRDMLLKLLEPPDGRPLPILNRKDLFSAAQDVGNEFAVDQALNGLAERAKRAFLRDAIRNHMDYIACLNFFEVVLKHLPGAEQSASKLLCQPLATLKSATTKCRAKGRNVYSHDKKANQMDCTEADCRELIDYSSELLRCFDPNNLQLSEKRSTAETAIRSVRSLLGHPPIFLRELKQVPGFDELLFQKTRFITDYDRSQGVLYFHDPAELQTELAIWERVQKQSAEALRQKEAAADGEIIPAASAESAGPASGWGLKAFREYRTGHLTQDQLSELVKKAVLLADARFWMDRDGSRLIANQIGPLAGSLRRKIAADWDTRTELFAIEKNYSSDHSESEIRSAKQAHSIMSFMRGNGFLQYLPPSNQLRSSGGSLLHLAETHPDTLFVFFTMDKTLCELIVQKQLQNVIPLYTVADGEVSMRSSIRQKILELIFGGETKAEAASEESAPVVAKASETPKPVEAPAQAAVQKPVVKIIPRRLEPPVPSSNAVRRTENSRRPSAIDEPIAVGSKLRLGQGGEIELVRQLGAGGEGIVYGTNTPSIVVKLYHPEKLTQGREQKIREMIKKNPGISQLCWPKDIVVDQRGSFRGFTMWNVSDYAELEKSVLLLQDKSFSEKMMPEWDRLSLAKLCRSLCAVFQRMHDRQILMGDVNTRNFLVKTDSAKDPQFVLVDCDSYQFGDYPCPVGTLAFTSPSIFIREGDNPHFGDFLRTESDECYSLASILFHILMLNQSPFSAKGNADMLYALRNYQFGYRIPGDPENTGVDTPDGPARMIWNNLHPKVRTCFGRVFKSGETVTIKEWIEALNTYIYGIEHGVYTKELRPVRYWDNPDPEKRKMVDFTCDLCKTTGLNMPKERYERDEAHRDPHICNNCRPKVNRARVTPAEIVCDRCRRTYQATAWDKILQEEFGKHRYCANCRRNYNDSRRDGNRR